MEPSLAACVAVNAWDGIASLRVEPGQVDPKQALVKRAAVSVSDFAVVSGFSVSDVLLLFLTFWFVSDFPDAYTDECLGSTSSREGVRVP